MLGDSHATHWFPAFAELARGRSIHFRGIAKSACLFSMEAVYHRGLKRPYTECAEWSRNVIDWLDRERPDVVLISQSPAYPADAAEGLTAALARLVEMGLDVRVIRSTPWLSFEPGKCLANSENWLAECTPSRSLVFRPDLAVLAAEKLKIKTLDFSDVFCDATQCPVIIGGVLVYRDSHHMTATFSKSLSEVVKKNLALEVLP
jgi:hypothetical protein